MAESGSERERQIRERWHSNLQAAGINVPENDRDRVFGNWIDRVNTLETVLKRAEAMEESPDYLADTAGDEVDRG